MADAEAALLAEQVAYYRARAGEYEDWWERRNQYDFGPETNAEWRAQMAEARAQLDQRAPFGDALELAGGTGVWTEQLARQAASVTTVDASPESLAINRARIDAAGLSDRVTHVEADLFAWRPERRYDTVFFGFWLSHVPESRWAAFWDAVAAAVAPGGQVVLVDNARVKAGHEAPGVEVDDQGDVVRFKRSSVDYKAGVAVRQLEDGREFHIVKRGWTAPELHAELADLGWDATVATTGWAFIWAAATRA